MASGVRTLGLAALLATIGVASAATADDLSKGIPSKEALQRKTALKLAGLATFVATSCRDLKLDNERFKKAITALGVTTHDLEDQKAQFAYLNYTMMYKQDIKANCARAQVEFGPNGKTLPDLFEVVSAPSQPPAASGPAPTAKAPDPKTPAGTQP